MEPLLNALFGSIAWLMNQPADRLGNVIYLMTLIAGAACIARGHRTGKLNLWDMVTSTDRNGIVRTDGRKMFEVIGQSVMVITFYFLTITARLSEWYVLIFAVSVIGARIARDVAQIKEAALGATRPSTTTTTTTATVTEEPK